VNILLAGKTHQVSEGATGFDLFELREVIAMHVNGEARDLSHVLAAEDKVEGILIDSGAGLEILRHSTAHVMAQQCRSYFQAQSLALGHMSPMGFISILMLPNRSFPTI